MKYLIRDNEIARHVAQRLANARSGEFIFLTDAEIKEVSFIQILPDASDTVPVERVLR